MDQRCWNGECIFDPGIALVFGPFRRHTHVSFLRQKAAIKNCSEVQTSLKVAFQALN